MFLIDGSKARRLHLAFFAIHIKYVRNHSTALGYVNIMYKLYFHTKLHPLLLALVFWCCH